MVRKIIHIDQEKCNGCGLCAAACHEGAIEIVNGKATLAREHFCDGFGDCLPGCPTGAITFEEREAPAYDEQAVLAAKKKASAAVVPAPAAAFTLRKEPAAVSQDKLLNWPVQLKLAPISAPYFDGADLLIAADCTAYAYAAFHQEFARGRVVLIGCPKLDAVDYSGKLTDLFRANAFRSITVLRMQVPCCGGLTRAVEKALEQSGCTAPCKVITFSNDGRILPV